MDSEPTGRIFGHDDPPEQAGMIDGILASLLARYGITQVEIDKVKAILNKIVITDKEITVNLKGTTVKIDK